MDLKSFKFYRKWKGGIWYQHKFTPDALELCCTFIDTWWARYDEINRYSKVTEKEEWQ